MSKPTGRFTLPGESGYEQLTLQLAKRWGADMIRDSDGTKLSDEIIEAGYGIYSTVCIMPDLIHVNEALSGFPVTVEYLSFEDILQGRLADFNVLINAGSAQTAWSGGKIWQETGVVTATCEWAYRGGMLIGIGEPSAVSGYATFFRLAAVLGVDKDTGARVCHGKWSYEIGQPLGEELHTPTAVYHRFGNGPGRLPLTDNAFCETAFFPEQEVLTVINSSDEEQFTEVTRSGVFYQFRLAPFDMEIRKI